MWKVDVWNVDVYTPLGVLFSFNFLFLFFLAFISSSSSKY